MGNSKNKKRNEELSDDVLDAVTGGDGGQNELPAGFGTLAVHDTSEARYICNSCGSASSLSDIEQHNHCCPICGERWR